ncbi:Holliday junction branch migration protein RuvA [Mesomycoplasma hyorhinis]|uniref:Holliday junction branch migration complex subunit RuvA n=1 Tax=Mesomycoplasma hyorhinis (strain MCLD) TaxID=936139 RepID=A0ABM5M4T6_MESHM|nr:Holliday junction DNA helicase RuvA [Mesomycoplasma hyorhinis MCLD]AEX14096.1 Holliday junction ATP-dependent DNA helicase RuvA [Mesomycoplasma hyorhinis GDL-1]AHA41091.1 Holliday junction ATP-dependent DNA helicase RuvA [Mesomycoplasma hyorhinis DBS 1050]AOD25324.1 Holliday junction ATP-dependent DNA helicase RuvA [Mesomycoplasma hyorhinis]VEU57844.1 Holliday junction DNA helicase RuvA [Mesomycoplasma hyorhinis]
MEIYKFGKIVSKSKNYLILEQNYVGHLIYVPNIDRFEKDESKKIYIYKYENEYSKTTYGFENFRERILFEDLISVQGIGPKTAIAILNQGWETAMSYIADGDWKKISEFPYLNVKNAKQIVFEFQNKYIKIFQNYQKTLNKDKVINVEEEVTFSSKTVLEDKIAKELEDTLKILGFQKKQINYALSKVQANNDFELLVEEAIKLISNAREFRN